MASPKRALHRRRAAGESKREHGKQLEEGGRASSDEARLFMLYRTSWKKLQKIFSGEKNPVPIAFRRDRVLLIVADQRVGWRNHASVAFAGEVGKKEFEKPHSHGGSIDVFVNENNRAWLKIGSDAGKRFGGFTTGRVKTTSAPQHEIQAAKGELLVQRMVF